MSAEIDVETWVKHKNHTPTGAFKVCGGIIYASPAWIGIGLVTATTGNHGQSIAFASRSGEVAVPSVLPCRRNCREL
ncbi:pyridoxal-phosphate dependent enzyme [Nocardia iowensis]|uniref:Pyridoxal-phosphate dependent enzyme n=1 Tax=Nocardia iowensis TaxID=204891 RepID=A0ABX8RYL0_NOCIO|nr:pyridoxal-phosphate dependent enzyme [Nocardia iowensis]